jgi:hypothetical protein
MKQEARHPENEKRKFQDWILLVHFSINERLIEVKGTKKAIWLNSFPIGIFLYVATFNTNISAYIPLVCNK